MFNINISLINIINDILDNKFKLKYKKFSNL